MKTGRILNVVRLMTAKCQQRRRGRMKAVEVGRQQIGSRCSVEDALTGEFWWPNCATVSVLTRGPVLGRAVVDSSCLR